MLIMVAAVLAVMVLSAATARAQEEIEAKTSDTVAHPLICHAKAGEAEAFAC